MKHRAAVKVAKPKPYAREIARGVRLLNTEYGRGWARLIDLRKLDLSSSTQCVLGQLYRNYYAGLDRLFLSDTDEIEQHGFTPKGTLHDSDAYFKRECRKLTYEWEKRIKKERAYANN
jgi:hypothetical protein